MPKDLDEHADGREVALTVGEELTLTLPENPTTGYRWTTEADGSPACELVRDEFVAPSHAVPGAGGHHTWTFRGARAGRGEVTLTYGRFGQAGKTFALHLVVAAA